MAKDQNPTNPVYFKGSGGYTPTAEPQKRCALCTHPVTGDGTICAGCGATKPPVYNEVKLKDRRGS